MKWVRCVYNGDYSDITVGKVYEVLDYNNFNIHIINDIGLKDYWSMVSYVPDQVWFEDITAEIINNKINQILNEVG